MSAKSSDTTDTRFAASTPAERRELYVDAIAAHRERASPFLTIEADPVTIVESDPDPDPDPDSDSDLDADSNPADQLGIPWIQFSDGTVNLDCTEDELEEFKGVLSSFPAFTIDELTRPEEAEGVNVRVSARTDSQRIAEFFDEVFRRVYDLDREFRAWVVDV